GSIIHPQSLPCHLLEQSPLPFAACTDPAAKAHTDLPPARTQATGGGKRADGSSFSGTPATPSHNALPEISLRDLQMQRINQALSRNRGNISKTARELGLHRSTVYRYLARANPRGQ
ncbi:MAG: helix-turn-helix domain-containing protein, partial [Advenella sp.]